MILRMRRWFSRLHSTRTIWSSLVPMPSIAFFSMVTSHSSDASVLAHGTGMYTEWAAPGGTAAAARVNVRRRQRLVGWMRARHSLNLRLPDFSPSRTVYSKFSP